MCFLPCDITALGRANIPQHLRILFSSLLNYTPSNFDRYVLHIGTRSHHPIRLL